MPNIIQLFRQRLSPESAKAYSTMPIGIMGSKSLALLDCSSRWFSNKERERTNMCLCCFLPLRWNTLRFTQATVKTTNTHNNFRHSRVSFSPFVRQPFSKQLYTLTCKLFTVCKTTFLETAVYIGDVWHTQWLWYTYCSSAVQSCENWSQYFCTCPHVLFLYQVLLNDSHQHWHKDLSWFCAGIESSEFMCNLSVHAMT